MNESRIYPLEAKVVHNGNEETRQIQRQIGRSRKYESWKPPDCEQFENLWHVAVLPWMIVKGRVWIDGEGERNQTNQILGVLGFDYSVSRKGTSTFSLLSSCWISTNCSSNPKLLPIYSLCLFLAHHYSFACDPCLFMDCFEMPFKRDLSYLIWTSCNPTSKAEEADVVNGVLESSNLAEEALDEVLAEEACEENVKMETPLRGLCCTKKFNNIHTKVTASINKRCQDCAIIYCKRAGYMLLIHENILSYLSKEDEVISDEEFTENVEMLSKIEKATSMMEETCLIGTLWRGIDVIMRPKQKLVVEWGFVKDDIEAVDQANNWLNPSLWSPKTCKFYQTPSFWSKWAWFNPILMHFAMTSFLKTFTAVLIPSLVSETMKLLLNERYVSSQACVICRGRVRYFASASMLKSPYLGGERIGYSPTVSSLCLFTNDTKLGIHISVATVAWMAYVPL